MTNSPGFISATPMQQMSLPLLMSSFVIVERSHLTKKASSCETPARPPPLHTRIRKFVILRETLAQVGS